mmetsp:Transcript_168006/g.534420  ORF Transcript_168006/g.534420 Transcript_168006/m.534420 type:complete len:994 (+) Transcript_168006:1618-4599(+)
MQREPPEKVRRLQDQGSSEGSECPQSDAADIGEPAPADKGTTADDPGAMSKWSVRELRVIIAAAGGDCSRCIEREDLLAEADRKFGTASQHSSHAQGVPGTDRGGVGAAAPTSPYRGGASAQDEVPWSQRDGGGSCAFHLLGEDPVVDVDAMSELRIECNNTAGETSDVAALVAMGFDPETAAAVLAATDGDIAAAAELLAESSSGAGGSSSPSAATTATTAAAPTPAPAPAASAATAKAECGWGDGGGVGGGGGGGRGGSGGSYEENGESGLDQLRLMGFEHEAAAAALAAAGGDVASAAEALLEGPTSAAPAQPAQPALPTPTRGEAPPRPAGVAHLRGAFLDSISGRSKDQEQSQAEAAPAPVPSFAGKAAGDAAASSRADSDMDALRKMSVSELRRFITEAGGDHSRCVEKQDLLAEAARAKRAAAAHQGPVRSSASSAAPAAADDDAPQRRITPVRDTTQIDGRREQILKAIHDHQILIVVSSTGSGKSTAIPRMIVEEIDGARVACTQPRRIAATSLARRVAKLWKTQVGEEVGYQIGGCNMVQDLRTRLVFMTTATAMLQFLSSGFSFTHIIIDEVHETSIFIDILLTLLRSKLLPACKNLKVILMSAAMDAQRLHQYFREGGTEPLLMDMQMKPPHPVTNRRLHEIGFFANQPLPVQDVTNKLVAAFVEHLHRSHPLSQSILVFLAGKLDVLEILELLRGNSRLKDEIVVKPVYGGMSIESQMKILQSSNSGAGRQTRTLILATDVIESSVTIPDVSIVVDTLQHKRRRWDPVKKESPLTLEYISRDEAKQRAGRTGRTGPGDGCLPVGDAADLGDLPRARNPADPERQLGGDAADLVRAACHRRSASFPEDDAGPAGAGTSRCLHPPLSGAERHGQASGNFAPRADALRPLLEAPPTRPGGGQPRDERSALRHPRRMRRSGSSAPARGPLLGGSKPVAASSKGGHGGSPHVQWQVPQRPHRRPHGLPCMAPETRGEGQQRLASS